MSSMDFVRKWQGNTNTERQSYQQFFLDLCALVDHPPPREMDPEARFFTFEAGVQRSIGGQGWADVWYKGHFAIEFKRPDGDLERAYNQLQQYREALENPPLLIVSDTQRIIIHTNFTNTPKQVTSLTLDDLLTPEGMRVVRAIFHNPTALRPERTTAQVTEEAAREFGRLAEQMRRWGTPADQIAHYLIRLLFILFAEDIELLPRGLFTRLVDAGRRDPHRFNRQMAQLFRAMAEGDVFGEVDIRWFNGGLFNDAPVLDVDDQALAILARVSALDWGAIEPSILGTLFVRSLDPAKRAQLGAHYTSEQDILLIVEPVLMQPLRREWATVQEKAHALATERATSPNRSQRARKQTELEQLLSGFGMRLVQTRVLDPACGSGNFLYVALRLLLDLEKELIHFCGEMQVQPFFPQVSPTQLYGIEINEYAHELAQATVWIGYLQWLHANGYGFPSEPILKDLHNIRRMDAILAYDAEGKPVEPEWPEAEVIVGNPPFLGSAKMRKELGAKTTDAVFRLYEGRVPGKADMVCYWFERARGQLDKHKVSRVGLLSTQSIRMGKSRQVLERVVETGVIFWAWDDRPWLLDGAAVRVAMVGFARETDEPKKLNGETVVAIDAGLSAKLSVSSAARLSENFGVGFEGIKKVGPFEVDEMTARDFLEQSVNPSGVENANVVKRWVNGQDLLRGTPPFYVIDFGIDTTESVAAEYIKPFEYVRDIVKPERDKSNNSSLREKWWLFERPRPAMRQALSRLERFIVRVRVSNHHVFLWIAKGVIPDGRLNVFARSDDYFFGVLQSQPHELWAMANASIHGDGKEGGRPTYNNRVAFETYPFPWPPGQEPTSVENGGGGGESYVAISEAAAELVRLRDAWLNPPDLPESELKKRTLTNLYNARPEWLAQAHERLDRAVYAGYGWEYPLADEEILARLLALNLVRSGANQGG